MSKCRSIPSMSKMDGVVCKFLRKIAPDRDWMYLAEVEHAWIAELVNTIATDMVQEGYVELPKDADGEHIHIGDLMAYADNTKPMEVVALVPPAVFLTEDGPRYADMCRHYHAPTVEDVLNELCTKAFHSREIGANVSYKDVIAEYAAKLQLREAE